jgi:hypothetical protein
MKRITTIIGLLLLGLLILALGAWGVLAIVFAGDDAGLLRLALALLFALSSLIALLGLGMARWRRRALQAYLLPLAALFSWYQGIEPSNARHWQADVAVLPYATIVGDRVTVHNIRNFEYRSETDYTPAYYDREFDLRQLVGVDMVTSYWMGPAIAHVFLSFAFADGAHLAISIETRKERHESYSTLKGFFRQYELYYVVADERDVIRLRTNYRRDPPEDVYLYSLRAPIENGRRLFLEYLHRMNSLRDRPEFYNTLTTNCTTRIWMSSRVNPQHISFSWKVLASGYVPEYLYENGYLQNAQRPFSEVQRDALINTRARQASDSADFSRLIRTVSP